MDSPGNLYDDDWSIDSGCGESTKETVDAEREEARGEDSEEGAGKKRRGGAKKRKRRAKKTREGEDESEDEDEDEGEKSPRDGTKMRKRGRKKARGEGSEDEEEGGKKKRGGSRRRTRRSWWCGSSTSSKSEKGAEEVEDFSDVKSDGEESDGEGGDRAPNVAADPAPRPEAVHRPKYTPPVRTRTVSGFPVRTSSNGRGGGAVQGRMVVTEKFCHPPRPTSAPPTFPTPGGPV